MTLRDRLDLPSGFSLDESDRPFLHVLQPSGRRIPDMRFNAAADPHLVNEAVWMWHLEAEEKIGQVDQLMGRGEYALETPLTIASARPSVHDLLCEALDATDWTGAEKQAWLESFHSAAHRHLREQYGRAS